MDVYKDIKAVIFDIDNTLIATNEFVFENIKETVQMLQEKNEEIDMPSDEEIMRTIAKNLPFEEIFDDLFLEQNEDLPEKVLSRYRDHAPGKDYDATPGAVEVIKKLKEQDLYAGLVTNRTRMIEDRLEQAGFDLDNFDFIASPPKKEFSKPHPKAFQKAIEWLNSKGIHTDQIVMFGDHTDDFYSAHYQNIKFAAVLEGAQSRQDFKQEVGLESNLMIEDFESVKIEKVLKSTLEVESYKDSLYNSSALDGRHAPMTRPLRHYFSEYALHKNRIKAEVEHLIALSEFFNGEVVRDMSSAEKEKLRNYYRDFSEQDAYEVLQYDHLGRRGIGPTEHDVKSAELWLKEQMENTELKDLQPFVHIFLTSADVNNLAYKSMLSDAVEEVFLPAIEKTMDGLADLAEEYADAPMIGRTHIQPASPTTFGKTFAVYLSRLVDAVNRLKQVEFTGKVNGAVGAYNSFQVSYSDLDWMSYSKELVESMGFEVEYWTDQRGTHADMIRVFQAIQEVGNIIKDLSIDMSLYASTGDIVFTKEESHVGSSTMPHKINPWFAEVAEGNIKKVNHIINSFSNELDVSRLQRDLSDHDLERSYGEAFGYVLVAIKHINISMNLIYPDTRKARENIRENPEILTEAIQTVLRKHQKEVAYEKLKEKFRGRDTTLEDIRGFVDELDISSDIKQELKEKSKPESYIGLSEKLAKKAVNKYEDFKNSKL